MNEFWKSIQEPLVACLLALIPVVAAALRAWLRARTRAWESRAVTAWEQIDSSAPDSWSEEVRERLAVDTLQRAGLHPEKALELARRTRPTPIPLERQVDSTPAAERDTRPSPGVKPPTG